jgi:3-deoxy-D-manno-octulosonic-acid transferase
MFLYRLLIVVFTPLLTAFILWQSISAKSARYFWQRLGFGYARLPKNSLWFHCASVGEVITLLPLLKNLHRKDPALKFIITTNTVTGGKIVDQQKLDYLSHSYLPFDWISAVKRFINTTRPAALFVMETEIWPNLFSVCQNRGVAIHIINARLSSKTTTAKPWVKALLKTALSKVSSISARSKEDALAYAQLGANKNIISTAGNLKFTSVLSDLRATPENNFSIDREYILVASTHDDEEAQIYKRWKTLSRKELLIIAPRHPERATAIIKRLQCDNISVRSKNESVTDDTEIFLLDTVGELKNYFRNAKLVIMGGSFIPVGGHNILEPASFNSAIITGPHMENFKQELALMLNKEAIVQVSSLDELNEPLNRLLDEKKYRETLQANTALLANNVEKILHDYTNLISTAIARSR